MGRKVNIKIVRFIKQIDFTKNNSRPIKREIYHFKPINYIIYISFICISNIDVQLK